MEIWGNLLELLMSFGHIFHPLEDIFWNKDLQIFEETSQSWNYKLVKNDTRACDIASHIYVILPAKVFNYNFIFSNWRMKIFQWQLYLVVQFGNFER